MPRAYTLADVFGILNQELADALGPDDIEVLTQLFAGLDDGHVSEVASVAAGSNSNNWGTAVWGEFLWG